MILEGMCALCGEGAPMSEMLHLVVSVEGDEDAWQQWWAHPLCIKGMFCDEALTDVREEIAETWA